jgi:hypothetical protein
MDKFWLTICYREILKLLVDYKFLTTAQIHTKLNSPHSYLTTWRWLDKLREMELTKSFPCQPNKGNNSEFGWLLTNKGANAIGFLKYNSHYNRVPTPEQLFTREMEIELETQIALVRNWQLIRPKNFSPSANIADKTEQYYVLSKAVAWNEYLRTGILAENPNSFHSLPVPLRANNHVAHYTLPTKPQLCLAITFIICPLLSGQVFWKRRVKEYEALAKRLPIVALFRPESGELLPHEKFLTKHNIRCIPIKSVSQFLTLHQQENLA